jgi:hypothetical protein
LAGGPYFLATIVLGVSLAFAYAAIAIKRGRSPDLGDAVGMFFSSAGIPAGLRICWISIAAEELGPFTEATDRIYLFVAGGVVLWVSFAGIARTFKRTAPSEAAPGETRTPDEFQDSGVSGR